MNDTEQHYAQIEKELLAVIFTCKRFNDVIFGHTVTIETDHQPLVSIFNKPIHASPGLLQWMLLQLQKYDIALTYKRGKDMHLANTLSCALRKTCEVPPSPDDDFVVMTVSFIP